MADAAPLHKIALARRTAATLTAAKMRKKASVASSPGDFAMRAKQMYELNVLATSAQTAFLHALSPMGDKERVDSLFEAIDEDDDGVIDGEELARRLRYKTAGNLPLPTHISDTFDTAVASFGDKLDKDQFSELMTTLVSETGSTLECIVEVIAIKVIFVEPSSENEEKFDSREDDAGSDALVDGDRLKALYRIIDINGDGEISFSEISGALTHLMKHDMDDSVKRVWAALLVSCKDDTRKLDYDHFCTLILNAVASSRGKIDFDDIAADLTISACGNNIFEEKGSLSEQFADGELGKIIDEMKAMEESSDSEIADAIQYEKLHKLFDLWDQDHGGSIDFAEFAVGMRKFQKNNGTAIEETVQSTLATMMVADDNGDQNISRQEFATLLIKFAKAAKVDLYDLVDFMVVRSVLRDDDKADLAYLASVKEQAEKRMSWLAAPTLSYNPERWGG